MSTKTTHKFTPASYLLQFFNSKQAMADFFGITRSAVSKWDRPKKYQGTNGKVPPIHWPIIIEKGYMTIEQLNSKSFESAPVTDRSE